MDTALNVLRRFCGWIAVRMVARPGLYSAISLIVVAALSVGYAQLDARYRLADQVPDRQQAVQASQRLLRSREERGASGRERGPLVRPIQQLGPDRVFQLPDLRTEDLLRDMDAVRGGGEARLLGDRDEIPEMTQLNVHR